jgi:hypothetical protein
VVKTNVAFILEAAEKTGSLDESALAELPPGITPPTACRVGLRRGRDRTRRLLAIDNLAASAIDD